MQPAPIGALCALHVGIAATTTCARCGNFMCATCAENGAAALCPSCRALSGSEFPLEAESDFSAVWGYCVSIWQQDLAMLSVASIIFLAITFGGSLVSNLITQVLTTVVSLTGEGSFTRIIVPAVLGQLIGSLVGIVAQGVGLVGLYRVLLDALEGKKADIARMFSQLHLLPRYLVMQLLFFAALTVPLLAMMAAIAFVALRSVGIDWQHFEGADFQRLFNPAAIGLVLLFSVVVLVGAIVVMPVTLFAVPELIVGNCSPMEAITRSWNLGSGQRLRLFGYGFVSGAVVLVGVMLCFIGMIPALPLAYMLLLALFLALRKRAPVAQGVLR